MILNDRGRLVREPPKEVKRGICLTVKGDEDKSRGQKAAP